MEPTEPQITNKERKMADLIGEEVEGALPRDLHAVPGLGVDQPLAVLVEEIFVCQREHDALRALEPLHEQRAPHRVCTRWERHKRVNEAAAAGAGAAVPERANMYASLDTAAMDSTSRTLRKDVTA